MGNIGLAADAADTPNSTIRWWEGARQLFLNPSRPVVGIRDVWRSGHAARGDRHLRTVGVHGDAPHQ